MNIDAIEFLWKSTTIDERTKCWLWTKGKTIYGHGLIWYNRSTWIVSRWSLCIYLKLPYKGDWQANHIDSVCPNKSCWNPLHLYEGTSSDNAFDRWKGKTFTHCSGCSRELAGENVYIYPNGRKECKYCRRIRDRRRQ